MSRRSIALLDHLGHAAAAASRSPHGLLHRTWQHPLRSLRPTTVLMPTTSQFTPSRLFRTMPSPLRTTQGQKREETQGSREDLNPSRSETSKTGTDDEVANAETAFDPLTTRPESEYRRSESESKQRGKPGNPLDVSPANKDVSGARDPMEGGPDRNAEKSQTSGKGTTPKNHKVHTGPE